MLPTPPNGYLSKDDADSALDKYLNAGKYDDAHLPKRADPKDADDFVRRVLDRKELGARHMPRIGELMRFYVLRLRIDQVATWLNRRESKPEDFPQPIAALAIIGDMGSDKQQADAAKYYQYLLSHRNAPANLGALVDLFQNLAPAADPKWIAEALDRRMAALQPKMAADRSAAVEYHDIEDIKRARWVAVQAAAKRRQEVVKLADAKRRRQEYARFYLGYERRPYSDFERWGMAMCQRECADGDPAQLADVFKQELDALVTRGSRPQLPPPEAEDIRKWTTRCTRAVAFYLGALTDPQKAFASQHENPQQDDVLYWDT